MALGIRNERPTDKGEREARKGKRRTGHIVAPYDTHRTGERAGSRLGCGAATPPASATKPVLLW